MQLELSAFVKHDLDEIGDYIARHNPTRAISFVDELIHEIEIVAANPLVHRLRKEIGASARVKAYGRYLILFSVSGDVVRIQRVVHGGRKLDRLYAAATRDV